MYAFDTIAQVKYQLWNPHITSDTYRECGADMTHVIEQNNAANPSGIAINTKYKLNGFFRTRRDDSILKINVKHTIVTNTLTIPNVVNRTFIVCDEDGIAKK